MSIKLKQELEVQPFGVPGSAWVSMPFGQDSVSVSLDELPEETLVEQFSRDVLAKAGRTAT